MDQRHARITRDVSACTGIVRRIPTQQPKCAAGKCDKSICTIYNASECGLSGAQACQVACIGPGWGDGSTCVSTADNIHRHSGMLNAVSKAAGSSCNKCVLFLVSLP